MNLRDVLLFFATLPLSCVVALRLAAAAGMRGAAPSAEAFSATLSLFLLALLLYIALTLRALARAALRPEPAPPEGLRRGARVTDFAIQLDRRATIELSEEEEIAAPRLAPAPGRNRILGELGTRLADIPSSRQATAGRGPVA